MCIESKKIQCALNLRRFNVYLRTFNDSMCIESKKIQCESKRDSMCIESKEIQCESKRDSMCIESKKIQCEPMKIQSTLNLKIQCPLNVRRFKLSLRRFNVH